MGPNPTDPIISYPVLRDDFILWLRSQQYNKRYAKDLVSYLDRFASELIQSPMDVVNIFAKQTPGQGHNMDRALRALFNFLESQGFNKTWLDRLRMNIPKFDEGFDVKVPSEQRIISSLQTVGSFNAKYGVLYNLILDSGLRLVEATRLMNNLGISQKIDRRHIETFKSFCVVPLGYFRKTKLAYFAFLTHSTMELLGKLNGEKVNDKNASGYRNRFPEVVAFKYLRKFSFDKMIELEIPESVADFIQGRTPKSMGAKHYMVLNKKAKKFYPRFAEYIIKLRQKADLS